MSAVNTVPNNLYFLSQILILHQVNNHQLLDDVEQNNVICQWRADQLFAKGKGK